MQVEVARQQVEAAEVQAKAAQAQAEAAEAQVEVARSQLRVMVNQASVSIRPMFKFRIAERGFVQSPVIIKNVDSEPLSKRSGSSCSRRTPPAKTRCLRLAHYQWTLEQEISWPFNKENPRLRANMVDEKY